jgi:hypothetical protein
MMSETETHTNQTTSHEEIRQWAESRKGRPAKVRTDDKGGILRIDFQEADEDLVEIDWDEFFTIFDQQKLAFLHQDKTRDGKTRHFNKFVDR